MIFKKSLNLLTGNVNLTFKVLVYTAVLIIICLAVIFAIVQPVINELFNEFALFDHIKESITSWLDGDNGSFKALLNEITHFFKSDTIALAIVLFIVLYMLLMFFVNFTAIPIAKTLFDKMRTGLKQKFLHVFISSLGKSIIFSLLSTIITVALDIGIFALFYVMLKYFSIAFKFMGITLSIIIFIILISLRVTILSQWIPQIVAEKKSPFSALIDAFKGLKKSFIKTFIPTLTVIIIAYIIIVSTALFTFFVSTIMIVPTYMVFLSAINLTAYFELNEMKIEEEVIDS